MYLAIYPYFIMRYLVIFIQPLDGLLYLCSSARLY